MASETPNPKPAHLVAIYGLYTLMVYRFWFLCDDAFITFRFARNWGHGRGPWCFNPGEFPPVEGYSNFLWLVPRRAPRGDRCAGPRPDSPCCPRAAGAVLLWRVHHVLRHLLGVSEVPALLATLTLAEIPGDRGPGRPRASRPCPSPCWCSPWPSGWIPPPRSAGGPRLADSPRCWGVGLMLISAPRAWRGLLVLFGVSGGGEGSGGPAPSAPTCGPRRGPAQRDDRVSVVPGVHRLAVALLRHPGPEHGPGQGRAERPVDRGEGSSTWGCSGSRPWFRLVSLLPAVLLVRGDRQRAWIGTALMGGGLSSLRGGRGG